MSRETLIPYLASRPGLPVSVRMWRPQKQSPQTLRNLAALTRCPYSVPLLGLRRGSWFLCPRPPRKWGDAVTVPSPPGTSQFYQLVQEEPPLPSRKWEEPGPIYRVSTSNLVLSHHTCSVSPSRESLIPDPLRQAVPVSTSSALAQLDSS